MLMTLQSTVVGERCHFTAEFQFPVQKTMVDLAQI